jgi:hypothetical protein
MRANEGNRRVRTWRKLALISSVGLLALSVIGGGTTNAATPTWTVGHGTSYLANPAPTSGASSTAVSAGARVGFFEWLHNGDTSNISQLFLNASTSPTATVFGAQWTIKDVTDLITVRSGTCPTATPLVCSFGALNSGQTVYVVVAYTLSSGLSDGTIENASFDFNTTGTPPGKNNSHGDLTSITDSVTVTNNGDAAGDFNFDQSTFTVADNQKLSGKNVQATSASFAEVLTGASVGDSPSLSIPCNSSLLPGFDCTQLTSLVSAVEVGNGKIFNNTSGGPGIKVVVIFSQSPKQLSGSAPFVYHYFTDSSGIGHAELITEACTYDANNLPTNSNPCLTVVNKMATVWLFHNGGLRM